MKRFNLIFSLLIMAISLTFCAMKHELQTAFPQDIQSVFYQKEQNTKGNISTRFYISLKKPLAKTIVLKKVYLRHQEGRVKEITSKKFIVFFPSAPKYS
jgi:hypothetical protein